MWPRYGTAGRGWNADHGYVEKTSEDNAGAHAYVGASRGNAAVAYGDIAAESEGSPGGGEGIPDEWGGNPGEYGGISGADIYAEVHEQGHSRHQVISGHAITYHV